MRSPRGGRPQSYEEVLRLAAANMVQRTWQGNLNQCSKVPRVLGMACRHSRLQECEGTGKAGAMDENHGEGDETLKGPEIRKHSGCQHMTPEVQCTAVTSAGSMQNLLLYSKAQQGSGRFHMGLFFPLYQITWKPP